MKKTLVSVLLIFPSREVRMERMMVYLVSHSSTLQNVLTLIAMLVIFALILVAVHYTTKWMGKLGNIQSGTKNIQVIETYRIAPNKFVQIVRVGTKYIAIAVGKEEISPLTELEESDLLLTQPADLENPSFAKVFKSMITRKDIEKKDSE